MIRRSPQAGRYDKPFDRESAYEILLARATTRVAEQPPVTPVKPAAKAEEGGFSDMLGSVAGKALQSAARQMANQVGRELVRGLLGSLLGKRR